MASRDVELNLVAEPRITDPEVRAVYRAVTALEPLGEHARRRVLLYLLGRYAYAPAAGSAPALSRPPDGLRYTAPDRRCDVRFGLAGSVAHSCWRERGHDGAHASPHSPFTGENDGAAYMG